MNELLKKDLKIKLLSLSFALLLWIFVVNSINPTETRDIKVPLEIRNVETLEQKSLKLNNPNYPENVVVKVRGRSEALKNVNENSFIAVLDFARVKSESDTRLKIDDVVYVGSENIKIESVAPRDVQLQLKKMGENEFPVGIVTENVEFADKYELYKAYTTQSTVIVGGEVSAINRIERLEAIVPSRENLDMNIKISNVECKAYDKDDNLISGLQIPKVEVVLEVAKKVKVIPDIEGNPAENYIDGESKATPDEILVTSDNSDILKAIESVLTEKVNITNASKTVNERKGLNIPQGIRLVEPNRKEVDVTVEIEQLAEKEFNVSAGSISIVNADNSAGLTYSISTESMIIKVKGERNALGMLYISDLKPFVDVAALGEGTHRVPLRVTLVGGSKLVEEYMVDVKVEKIPVDDAG